MAEDPQELTIMDALRKVVKNQSKGETQVEQSSGAGRVTPGLIARRLVSEEGTIGKSVEAGTKVEQNTHAKVAAGTAPEVKSNESGTELDVVARPRPSEGVTQAEVERRTPEEALALDNHDGAQPTTATVAVN